MKIQNLEGVPSQTCMLSPIDFQTNNFDYAAYLQGTIQVPTGCSTSDVIVSRLYMSQTCLSERNNEQTGCSTGSNATMPSWTGQSVTLAPTSNSAATCNVAFATGPPNSFYSLATLAANPGKYFDSGAMCTKTQYGYFLIQNNCGTYGDNARVEFTLTVQVEQYYSSCSPGSHSPLWLRIVLGIAFGLAALGIVLGIFMRRRRMAQAQPMQVQMGQPPILPYGQQGGGYGPAGGYGGGPQNGYNGGGQQAYAGAWGSGTQPQQQPGGYSAYGGAPGGYGQQPGNGAGAGGQQQFAPPPLTTATVGYPPPVVPSSEGGDNSSYPPPVVDTPGYPAPVNQSAPPSGTKGGGAFPKV